MRRLVLGALCVTLVTVSGYAQTSLWSGVGGPANPDLAREVKARDFKIHDIISIIVQVSADAVTEEEIEVEKKDTNNFAINQYIKLRQNGIRFALEGRTPENLGIDLTSNRKYENEGTSERTDKLRARLAAEIVDIKPNGNLVIEAKQQFTKQREKTVITLSGVVRPQDVLADNVVYSHNIADADIRYESSGPVTNANSRGWLAKALDKLWPF